MSWHLTVPHVSEQTAEGILLTCIVSCQRGGEGKKKNQHREKGLWLNELVKLPSDSPFSPHTGSHIKDNHSFGFKEKGRMLCHVLPKAKEGKRD